MGDELKDRVESKQRATFYADLEKGNRLGMPELKRLSTLYKDTYINYIKDEDNETTEYVHKAQNIVKNQRKSVRKTLRSMN